MPRKALNGLDASGKGVVNDRARNAQTGTSYTPDLTDAGSFITLANAAAVTFTIPPQSSVAWLPDTVLQLAQYGAGQVTVAPGAGVTLRQAGGLKTASQYAVVELRRMASDEWLVYGRTSP